MARLRLLSLLAFFSNSVVASVCRQSGSSPVCGPNVVTQGMFADGGGPLAESGWTINGGEAYVPSYCSSSTITSCLVFYQDATLVQTITTTPGSLYAFSFSLLAGTGTFPLVACGPTDNNGDFLVGEQATSAVTAKNVWQAFMGSFVATDATTEFKCEISGASGYVAVFSNVQVSLNCIAPEAPAPSSVSSVLSASSSSASPFASSSASSVSSVSSKSSASSASSTSASSSSASSISSTSSARAPVITEVRFVSVHSHSGLLWFSGNNANICGHFKVALSTAHSGSAPGGRGELDGPTQKVDKTNTVIKY